VANDIQRGAIQLSSIPASLWPATILSQAVPTLFTRVPSMFQRVAKDLQRRRIISQRAKYGFRRREQIISGAAIFAPTTEQESDAMNIIQSALI
jgi:hypothetical protein